MQNAFIVDPPAFFSPPADNTPNLKRKSKKRKSSLGGAVPVNDMDEGVKALLSHAVREAIYDIRPTAGMQRIRPFMYWNPNKSTSCIKMLLKRSPALRVLADRAPKNGFARMYKRYVQTVATNERSMQKRAVKELFLKPGSEYAMVADHVYGTQALALEQEPRLTTKLSSEFPTVKDLRNALASTTMYTHPKLFDLFCSGLESGKLRSTDTMQMTRIQDVITIGHENHFRLELWFALRGGNYSHDSSKKSIAERYEKFGQLCRAVNEDRHDNADPAFTIRSATREAVVDEADSSSDSDDGIGQDYF